MGGHAIQDAVDISKEDIPQILTAFAEAGNFDLQHLHLVGSGGKRSFSNDLDIVVDSNVYDMVAAHGWLTQIAEDSTINHGTNVASYGIVFGADLHQIDLMYTSNVEWARFAYFSAGDGSNYCGAVRTILLTAVAAAIHVDGVDYFGYHTDGSLLIRAGRVFDLNVGLRRLFQHRPMRKDGTDYTKTLKSITQTDFTILFPDVYINSDDILLDSPEDALALMFDKAVLQPDVETAEQVLDLIKECFDEEKQQTIFDIARKRSYAVRNKITLPMEIR